MPLCWIDKTLVKPLQNVRLDVSQPKAVRVSGNLRHQFVTATVEEKPVKKIAFDSSENAQVSERLAGQEDRTGRRQRVDKRRRRNGFRNDG
jgi:hypothetical protein